MLTRQMGADALGVPSTEPRKSDMLAALGDGGGLPLWLRIAVVILCVSHVIGIAVGFMKGGSFFWVAAFGAAMIGALVLLVAQCAMSSRPE